MTRAEKRHQKKFARKAARKQGDTGLLAMLLDDGLAHHQAGRLPEAEAIYSQILKQTPDHPDGNHLLGVLAHQRGQWDAADELIRKAIAVRPDYVQAHNNLGNLLRDQGRPDEAAESYGRALALEPDFAMAQCNLGNAHKDRGHLDDAVQAYRAALAIEPAYADAHNNLGLALHAMGRLDEAAGALLKALALAPDFAGGYSNLGLVLQDQGKLDEALVAYDQALGFDPALAETHANRGLALRDMGRLSDAAAAIGKSLELQPLSAEAHNNLASVYKDQGRLPEAVAAFRKALEIKPDYAVAHSNLILSLNYSDDYSQADIYGESRRWEVLHGATDRVTRQCGREPARRLRLGYVSPDFKAHSVSRFLDPLIAGHDRVRFEVFCYAQVACPDHETRRIAALADGWCSTVGMSNAALADRVRDDKIDILVDLAGHTGNNRLAAFAHHPAPVQVAWLGYPNTTGLAAMDYRLTDAVADPQGPGDDLYSETLIRLEGGFLCFTPDGSAPPVSAPSNDHITFGSFNNLSKVTPAVVAAWARILEAVPGSRLLLKNRSLADEATRQAYVARFADHGVDSQRLEFCAWIDSPTGHLGAYERIDIGLDPFPYNGTTTTCEALWMGVPVISLRGERHAGRVGASLLTTVGQAALIAETVDDYVAAAARLAGNKNALAALRRSLRPALAASPLCDAAGFTRSVEAAYRDMWRRWCEN